MSIAEDVARALVEADAIQVAQRPAGGALDAARAGESPPFSLDVCRLTSHPQQSEVVVSALAGLLRPHLGVIDTIVSPNTSSVLLATLVASSTRLPMVYVRPKPKEHGRQRQVEGVLREGARALLLFDAIVDADAARECAEVIERHGGKVTRCLAVLASSAVAIEARARLSSVPLLELTDLASVRTALVQQEAAPASGSTARSSAGSATAPGHDAAPAAATDDARHDIRVNVAQMLLRIGAVSIDAAAPFRYASGILSPIYTDNRLLISHPDAWQAIVDGFVSTLPTLAGAKPTDVLAGAATAGIPHAARLAERTGLPMVYVDLNEQEGTLQGRVHGSMVAGDEVVIVEDLVTTGKSVIESVMALRERGVSVNACLAIFTYNPAAIGAALQSAGLSFTSLSDLDTLLDVAIRDGQITEADRTAVLDWLRDPRAWSQQAEARLAGTAV